MPSYGLENTPWDEPSEKSGFCTSIGNGRYSILLSLAWAIEDLVDDPNGNIPHLIDIVEQTFRSPSEHQYPELRNNCKKSPHTLDRDIYTSFYIPAYISYPIFVTVPILNYRTNEVDRYFTISIGSSSALVNELQSLERIVKEIVAIRGESHRVPSYGSYSWGAVYDACDLLLQAARDSLTQNLLLKIMW